MGAVGAWARCTHGAGDTGRAQNWGGVHHLTGREMPACTSRRVHRFMGQASGWAMHWSRLVYGSRDAPLHELVFPHWTALIFITLRWNWVIRVSDQEFILSLIPREPQVHVPRSFIKTPTKPFTIHNRNIVAKAHLVMSAQKSSAADGFVKQMGWRPGCKHYDKVCTQMVCCVATIRSRERFAMRNFVMLR